MQAREELAKAKPSVASSGYGFHFFKKLFSTATPEEKKDVPKLDIELIQSPHANLIRLTKAAAPYFEKSTCLDAKEWAVFIETMENEENIYKALNEALDCFSKLADKDIGLVINLAYFFHLNFVSLNESFMPTIKQLLNKIAFSQQISSGIVIDSVETHIRFAEIIYCWARYPSTHALILMHARAAAYHALGTRESDLKTELQIARAVTLFDRLAPHEELFPKLRQKNHVSAPAAEEKKEVSFSP